MKTCRFKYTFKIIFVFTILLAMIFPSSCGKKQSGTVEVKDQEIIHDLEYGGVFVKLKIDDFHDMGFKYGDSLDISFSNGLELKDLPYYNDYIAKTGEYFVIGYPDYEYIKIIICNGGDFWPESGLTEDDKASVSLNEAGKYVKIQEAMDLKRDDDRSHFPDDETFANFREITAGNIKPKTLYRSSSPHIDQIGRAEFTDKLLDKYNIKTIINLSESKAELKEALNDDDFDAPNMKDIYEDGNVKNHKTNMNYKSEEFRDVAIEAIKDISISDGPYLIHCKLGKDRTGIICFLLEALCGATYEEAADDYMKTYENLYGLSKTEDKEKYDIIKENVFDDIVKLIVTEDSENYETADLSKYARDYFLEGGMTEDEINRVIEKLSD